MKPLMQRRCLEGKFPGSCPLCSPPPQGAALGLSGNGGSLTMWPRAPGSSGSLPKTQPHPPKAQRRSTVLMPMWAPGWAVDSDAWCFSGICWDAGNVRTLPAWGNSNGSARFEELWPGPPGGGPGGQWLLEAAPLTTHHPHYTPSPCPTESLLWCLFPAENVPNLLPSNFWVQGWTRVCEQRARAGKSPLAGVGCLPWDYM